MSITIDLTTQEEATLQGLAEIRGVRPEEHAHLLLTNLLRSVPVQERHQPADQEKWERLTASVKAGDKAAWLELLYMPPPISRVDPTTGEPLPPIPDEALRRENMYEDRS